MEWYGALPTVGESESKASASSVGVHLDIHVGGFRQWNLKLCDHEVCDKLHF